MLAVLAAPVPIAGTCFLVEVRAPHAASGLFTLTGPTFAQADDLVLARINNQLLVGRYVPNVAGFDWLVQPSRLIRCARKPVILGRLQPWLPYAP